MELTLDSVIPFGRHKGNTIEWIIKNDLMYMFWLVSSTDRTLCKDALIKIIKKRFEEDKEIREDSFWASEADIY